MFIVEEREKENPEIFEDIEIIYNEKPVKISELTDQEKIDCISKLWKKMETLEGEKEVLQEMIQKMYFFGTMEKLDGEKTD